MTGKEQIVTEQERELINAAIHYVNVAKDLSLSAYVKENGRHRQKSPWAELVDAVNALKPST
jgi:hypothetical protein